MMEGAAWASRESAAAPRPASGAVPTGDEIAQCNSTGTRLRRERERERMNERERTIPIADKIQRRVAAMPPPPPPPSPPSTPARVWPGLPDDACVIPQAVPQAVP
jgi:hypothetical protein